MGKQLPQDDIDYENMIEVVRNNPAIKKGMVASRQCHSCFKGRARHL